MAKRKVILHGPSTLTVSLPARWVKKNHIGKGDEINVEEEGDRLSIFPGKGGAVVRKGSLDLSDLDAQTIKSLLSVMHKSGYDEVDITFEDTDTLKVIQERINSMLLGYEIVEQKRKSCVIKSISGDSPSELSNLMRRCFLVSISLADGCYDEMSRGDHEKLEDLLILENTSNKLTNYCHRLLNKQPYKDEKTIYAYIVVWLIESICDDYRDMILHVIQSNQRPSKAFIGQLEEVNECLEAYYSLFYDYSDLKLKELRNRIKVLRKKHDKTEDKALKPFLFSILSRIHDCLGSTAGLNH